MADDSVSRKSNVVYTLFGPKTPLKRGATGQGLQSLFVADRSQTVSALRARIVLGRFLP